MKIQYFATTNDHKLREVSHILGYELEKMDLELTEPQDMDLEVIARAKAEEAFQKIGKPVLVEDTGWYFDAWNGLPGPFAKWFKETVGIDGVLKMMSSEENRKARGKTAVAYHDGKGVHVFVAEVSGVITREKRGDSGFAYDSIFIPDDQGKTFGEMTMEKKNSLSMRALAVNQLKKFLDTKEA